MKKVLAVNSDPRKHSETAQLLEASLEGAREAGAQTRMIQLCDLSFSGCIGCASCKRLGHPSYNKCILKDDLTAICRIFWNAGFNRKTPTSPTMLPCGPGLPARRSI